MTTESGHDNEKSVSWRSVYLAVVIYTVLVVTALWLFGRWFTG